MGIVTLTTSLGDHKPVWCGICMIYNYMAFLANNSTVLSIIVRIILSTEIC